MEEERIVKSNFLMKITKLEVLNEETNDESGETTVNKYKVVDEKWVKMRGKQFIDDIREDRSNGINHSIQVVNKAPDKFKINEIYVLSNGKRAWTYITD